MKVLLLEMGGSHIECIYTFAHFLQLKKHEVYLACNEKLLPLFPGRDQLNGILSLPDKISGISQVGIFLTIRKYILRHKIDTLVINTTEPTIIRNFSFYIPRKVNCTGVVHNAKKLEKSFTFTKILSGKISKFFVLGDYLLQETRPDPVFKVAAFFPIYFPPTTATTVTKPEGEFWITIPGEAEQKRRDYLALIALLQENGLPGNIKFIFLGKYKLEDVIEYETTNTGWWKKYIIHFNERVDYNSFHAYIRQSDIILPLIKLQQDDLYGNSRISGSFNLGLGYHKPFLLPHTYSANTDLAPYSIYYDNMDDLAQKIRNVCAEPSLLDDIRKRYSNGPFKNVDAMADDIVSFIALKLPA